MSYNKFSNHILSYAWSFFFSGTKLPMSKINHTCFSSPWNKLYQEAIAKQKFATAAYKLFP